MPIEWILPAIELYKERHTLASGWDRVIAAIFGAKARVAIVGPGGVGKSVLLDHVTGDAFKAGYTKPAKSRRAELGKAKADGQRLAMVVVPGQGGPELDTMNEVLSPEKPVDGVMFVVGNGFITLRDERAKQVNIERGYDTIDKWRKLQIEAELRDLRETLGLMRAAQAKSRKPKWMMVCVTKVDLMQDELTEIEAYYSPHGDSEFSQEINTFTDQVGSDNFEWDAAPVCSILEPFEWGEDVRDSNLDAAARDHYISQMVDRVGEMCR